MITRHETYYLCEITTKRKICFASSQSKKCQLKNPFYRGTLVKIVFNWQNNNHPFKAFGFLYSHLVRFSGSTLPKYYCRECPKKEIYKVFFEIHNYYDISLLYTFCTNLVTLSTTVETLLCEAVCYAWAKLYGVIGGENSWQTYYSLLWRRRSQMDSFLPIPLIILTRFFWKKCLK